MMNAMIKHKYDLTTKRVLSMRKQLPFESRNDGVCVKLGHNEAPERIK